MSMFGSMATRSGRKSQAQTAFKTPVARRKNPSKNAGAYQGTYYQSINQTSNYTRFSGAACTRVELWMLPICFWFCSRKILRPEM